MCCSPVYTQATALLQLQWNLWITHIWGSNDARSWEVVPISEVIMEATPLNSRLSGCGLFLTAQDIVNKDAKRALRLCQR